MASEENNQPAKIDSPFFEEVRSILDQGRSRAVTAVNTAMVQAYWLVGKRIVEEEQEGNAKATYGERLIEELSRNLNSAFGKGFSAANLRNFRQFYQTYPDDDAIRYAMRSELSWTHHRLIMRETDQEGRRWYLTQASSEGWSSRVLERQIKSRTFERLIDSDSVDLPQEEIQNQSSIRDFIKDPYVLEFLSLSEEHSESEFETAIVSELQKFLLEMGNGFSFVARQMRISTETSHFYMDLVFYNYILKCFVVIDLKTEKLTHQDIGQMDMYVRMFDDLKRGEDDNPTIGLILCADKDETMVQYSVLRDSEQLFASKYQTVLPTEAELTAELERELALMDHSKES